MNREDLHVGQRVTIHNGQGGRHAHEQRGEIVHIARLLITVADVMDEGKDTEHLSKWPEKYRIEDRHKNVKDSRYWFETDPQRAEREHNHEVNTYLHEVGIEFSHYKDRITQEHKERLAGLLKELGYTGKLSLEQAYAGK